MAEKLLRVPKKKIAAKKTTGGQARATTAPTGTARAPREPYKAYYVFKTSFLDYGPKLDDPDVLIRAMDFATGRGRTKSVKKAYDQYKADGEFAPLAHYLPTELSQVPRERLRVCEAAVQLDFFPIMGDCVSKSVPFPPLQKPKFTFIDLFAGIGGFHLAMHKMGGKCVFVSEGEVLFKVTNCDLEHRHALLNNSFRRCA